jgi:hypothetical protein
MTTKKSGIDLIAEERERQIEVEGWTAQHDQDEHGEGQLAEAAAYYAFTEEQREWTDNVLASTNSGLGSSVWPWEPKWFKPTPDDRIKELTKAGALIAAEIDRLQNL